jgi:ATP-dependent Lhr-like helicase
VARGVGPETAGRILLKQREDELALLRDILEAEVHYAKTRQFWD